MIVKNCVGEIPTTPPNDVTTWSTSLFELALSAFLDGNRLLIFEVPVKEIAWGNFDQVWCKPIPEVDAMLFDPEFLRSL